MPVRVGVGDGGQDGSGTRIERTYYDSDGRPVETADITVPDVRWEIAYEISIE